MGRPIKGPSSSLQTIIVIVWPLRRSPMSPCHWLGRSRIGPLRSLLKRLSSKYASFCRGEVCTQLPQSRHSLSQARLNLTIRLHAIFHQASVPLSLPFFSFSRDTHPDHPSPCSSSPATELWPRPLRPPRQVAHRVSPCTRRGQARQIDQLTSTLLPAGVAYRPVPRLCPTETEPEYPRVPVRRPSPPGMP